MSKVYELPNGHRMVADIDESTRVCNITETTLDSLVSELNYYADGQADVLGKIRAEIMKLDDINPDYPMDRTIHISRNEVLQIIDKYNKAESEG